MRYLLLLIQLLVLSKAHADFDTLKLNGQWEWIETNPGGFVHIEYTPESEGITRRVNIAAKRDDDTIIFEAMFYRNDTLTDSAVAIDSFFVLVFAWITPREIGENELLLHFYGDTVFRASLNVANSSSHMYRKIGSTKIRALTAKHDNHAQQRPVAEIRLSGSAQAGGMLFDVTGRRLLPMQSKMNPILNTPHLLIHLRERKSQDE